MYKTHKDIGICWCKGCRKAKDAVYFQKNKQRKNTNVNKRRDALTEWVRSLKKDPCTDCGNTYDPVAMQWDHVSSNKIASVSDLAKGGNSKTKILEEINKCELVCANCHAIRTHSRRVQSEIPKRQGTSLLTKLPHVRIVLSE